jgi:hypothetical protein
MRRSRTTRYETLGNAALFSFSVRVSDEDGTKIAFDKTGAGPAVIIVNRALQYRAFEEYFKS